MLSVDEGSNVHLLKDKFWVHIIIDFDIGKKKLKMIKKKTSFSLGAIVIIALILNSTVKANNLHPTIVVIGRSGVGKSSISNIFIGRSAIHYNRYEGNNCFNVSIVYFKSPMRLQQTSGGHNFWTQ